MEEKKYYDRVVQPPGGMYADYPPPPPPPPQQKSHVWLWVLLVLLVAIGVGMLLGAELRDLFAAYDAAAAPEGESIAVLYVEGTMSTAGTSGGNGGYDHQFLLDSIDMLIADENNKALLLYISSGGGEVLAASELGDAVAEYKQETGRPVYAYGYDYAASGAYWLAAAADSIWLNRYCTTGSIGVTFGTLVDLSGLLERYGVRVNTVNSGAMKSMGSSLLEMSDEERAVFQSFIDEYYGYFIDWIVEQRGMERADLLKLADGRIYTAKQAVDNGLADQIGDYEACLTALAEAAGLEDDDYFVRELYPEEDDFGLLYQLLGSYQGENASGELKTLLQLLPPTGALAYYQP